MSAASQNRRSSGWMNTKVDVILKSYKLNHLKLAANFVGAPAHRCHYFIQYEQFIPRAPLPHSSSLPYNNCSHSLATILSAYLGKLEQ